MSIDFSRLLPLGWGSDFSAQIPFESLDAVRPARVVGSEREHYRVDDGAGVRLTTLSGRFRHEHRQEKWPTVGDWVLLAADSPVIVERLEPRTLIARRAAGDGGIQPLAANVDLMVIVSGLDGDFNLHRIERYLVMAAQADVAPLVLLTKADRVTDPAPMVEQVRGRLPPLGEVLAVNAVTDPLSDCLGPWLANGTTLVVVGSSGVGKSTVINNLVGQSLQATGATRRDSKGRHTTTSRSLVRLPGGACVIDVPGLREVGLAAEGGVRRQFGTIAELAAGCRFSDCSHHDEPDCAVRRAVEHGEVDPDEWEHYLRLIAEERHNVAEHERRRRNRVFGRAVRRALEEKRGTDPA